MNKNYNLIIFSIVLSFVALIGLLFGLGVFDFVIEISVIFGLLIAASVLLHLFVMRFRYLWSFSTVYFSINILNAVYLYFVASEVLVFLYALFSFIGLFVSLTNMDMKDEIKKNAKEMKYIDSYIESKNNLEVKVGKNRKVHIVEKRETEEKAVEKVIVKSAPKQSEKVVKKSVKKVTNLLS